MDVFFNRLHYVGVDECHKWHYQDDNICQMTGLAPTEVKSTRIPLTKMYKIGKKSSELRLHGYKHDKLVIN